MRKEKIGKKEVFIAWLGDFLRGFCIKKPPLPGRDGL